MAKLKLTCEKTKCVSMKYFDAAYHSIAARWLPKTNKKHAVNTALHAKAALQAPPLTTVTLHLPDLAPGFSTLVLSLRDVGEINSTVLRSDNLASITRLRIEGAGVTAVSEGAFASFEKLTNLSLNQNLLTEINGNWFGKPDILSELQVAENRIEVLKQSMLGGLVSLQRLNLRKNRIKSIDPDTFSSQTALAVLDLSENRMTRVSPQVFRSLTSTRIRLDGNPWDCSCGLEDFADLLKGLR